VEEAIPGFTLKFGKSQMSQRQMEHLVPIESMMGPSGGKGDYWIQRKATVTKYGTISSSTHALYELRK